MTPLPDIAGMAPDEAYRAGFAEAQRRAEALAARLGGGPVVPERDGPFARGQKLTGQAISTAIAVMQPERA